MNQATFITYEDAVHNMVNIIKILYTLQLIAHAFHSSPDEDAFHGLPDVIRLCKVECRSILVAESVQQVRANVPANKKKKAMHYML